MTCTLCGFDDQQGAHAVYEMDLYTGDICVCRPVVVVRNPRRIGVLTGIQGAPEPSVWPPAWVGWEEKKG